MRPTDLVLMRLCIACILRHIYPSSLNNCPPKWDEFRNLKSQFSLLCGEHDNLILRFSVVFVILTSFDVLIEIMAEAYDLGLTGKNRPHQAFIGFQLNAKIRRKNYIRQTEMFFSPITVSPGDVMYRSMKGARSLLIISAAQPVNTNRYEKFRMKLVNRTINDPPFNTAGVYDTPTVGD